MSVLAMDNAAFRYKGEKYIFKDVSFSLEEGQILSIIGPNGSGKSTLLNCLAGLLKLDTGEITLEGKSIASLKAREIAKIIGYVPQNHSPAYGYTVHDFVVMGRAPHLGIFASPGGREYEIAWQALESIGITHLAGRPYTEISGGERQQATIARVIAQQPNIIMMDEPTSSLDYGNQMLIVKLIRKLASEGYAVIMTTHTPDHAIMLDDTVALMDRSGGLNVGSTEDIMNEDALKHVYRVNLKLVYVEQAGRTVCIPCMGRVVGRGE
ncbi:MAG: ABC transporter ATP-binding protein [Synergistaceae bacterium]|jgi:iron complex transport system ATP-binding protein|nr:ABC transporter ATP-binding protein [Synergistaceae bacterium]